MQESMSSTGLTVLDADTGIYISTCKAIFRAQQDNKPIILSYTVVPRQTIVKIKVYPDSEVDFICDIWTIRSIVSNSEQVVDSKHLQISQSEFDSFIEYCDNLGVSPYIVAPSIYQLPVTA